MEEQQTVEAADAQASDTDKKSGRDTRGRFVVGVSGNPKGKAPVTPDMKAVHELAAVERAANVARLVDIRDTAVDVWARIEAVKVLLQYSDGKPVTAHRGAPLVGVNVNVGMGAVASSGGQLTPAMAYKMMVEGLIPATGDHPAFRGAVLEHQPEGEPT